MDSLFEELASLIEDNLKINCPVMSGNMKTHIAVQEKDNGFMRVVISGPSYDISNWKNTGKIKHNGKYDYASSVNALGAFGGKSKKSQFWANKAIVKACQTIAAIYNAEVVINVEL